MNETENKHSVCAANCPLNRVITVHDIGFADYGYDDPEAIEYYSTPPCTSAVGSRLPAT